MEKHEHSLGGDNRPLEVAHLNDNWYVLGDNILRVRSMPLLPGDN